MKKALSILMICASCMLMAQTFTTYTTADGMPSDNTRDVAIDASNNVWVATQNGVAMFDGSTFTVHNTTTHPGLADDNTHAIAVMDNGDVWVGTDFGVSVFDGSSYTTYTESDGLSDDEINYIAQAPNGDIWMGTMNGATQYDGSTFTAFGMPDIPFGGVEHVTFNGNDVWMSGGLMGVIIYDGSNFSYLTTSDGLISNKITSIAVENGNKWVGTAEGISVMDNANAHVEDHTTPFLLPAPDTLNPITDIVMSYQGYAWVGVYVDYLVTEGGVCFYDGNTWTQYETSDGLAGPNVRRLAMDLDDDVWVTTSTGLTEISNPNIGIEEYDALSALNIYPNPATDQVNLVLENDEFKNSAIEVFDAQMRRVHSGVIQARNYQIEVSSFDPGMYFVQIENGIRKFAVMR